MSCTSFVMLALLLPIVLLNFIQANLTELSIQTTRLQSDLNDLAEGEEAVLCFFPFRF